MTSINDFIGIGKIFEKFPELDLDLTFSEDQKKIINDANEAYKQKLINQIKYDIIILITTKSKKVEL